MCEDEETAVKFLEFETLSLFPIDTVLIDKNLLTEPEPMAQRLSPKGFQ
ncbi:MAG: M24 family metallopeptidase C-terminal domain-containing protein [Saprospiraceae bacterium]|nr:M24 family metallopeptidase C-terminal domain-containing protein [Saprospiraceae bacterium]